MKSRYLLLYSAFFIFAVFQLPPRYLLLTYTAGFGFPQFAGTVDEMVRAALLGAQGVAAAAAVIITLVCRVVTLWLAIGWPAVSALPANRSLLKEV